MYFEGEIMSLLMKEIKSLRNIIFNCDDENLKKYYFSVFCDLVELASLVSNENYDDNIFFNMAEDDSEWQHSVLKNLYQTSFSDYQKMVTDIYTNGINVLKKYNKFIDCNQDIELNFAKELVIDFFNQYDKDLFSLIKKCLNDNHLIINKNNSSGGSAIYNPVFGTPYIYIETHETFSLFDLECLVHELGHVVNFVYSKHDYKSLYKLSSHPLVEVPADYFQFLFLHFLLKNNLYNEKIEILIYNFLSELRKNLILLYIVSPLKITKNLKEDHIYNFADDLELVLDGDPFSFLLQNYQYSYGPLIALSFLSNFQNDEEKTKYDIQNFMKYFVFNNNLKSFNYFGLNIDNIRGCSALKKEVFRNSRVLIKKGLID